MQLRKQNAFFFLDFMIEYEHKKHINQIKKEGNKNETKYSNGRTRNTTK